MKPGPSHMELESVHTAHLRTLLGLAGRTCPGERSHTYDVISHLSIRTQAVLQVFPVWSVRDLDMMGSMYGKYDGIPCWMFSSSCDHKH